MSEPEDPNVVVGEEQSDRLRHGINTAYFNAMEKFCDDLYDVQGRYGLSDAEITKALAEFGLDDAFLDAWNEYVEDNS